MRLIESLRLLDLSPGDVVWVEAQNNSFGLLSMLACWKLDLCLVPIDPESTADQLRALSFSLTPRLFIVSESFDESRFVMPQSFLRIGLLGDVLISKILPGAHRNLANISMIQLSSGTTGAPKKICLSKEAILWRAAAIKKALNLTGEDRTLCTVPISHSHGVDCLILPTLLAQGVVVLFEPKTAYPYRILKWIEEYRISFFSSVPQMYHQFNLLERPDQYDLSSLRNAFCGSAALSDDIAPRFLANFGIRLKQGYGLAEIGVITLNQNVSDSPACSIGLPMDGTNIRITAEGELVAASPGLFSCYLDDSKLTASRLISGELMTEDLVSRDSHGSLLLIGRKSEFLNVLGQKFYPREVEDLLHGFSGISNCALVSEANLERGDLPVLHLESGVRDREHQRLIEKEIEGFLKVRLLEYKIPKLFCWHVSFPKSSLGKVLRENLRQSFGPTKKNLFATGEITS
ncbi:MAG: acyl--CoA ligase [Bdellovibrionales bacterium]|nr:acyl--CoA ligase [Bdellovibrionales bacterium]